MRRLSMTNEELEARVERVESLLAQTIQMISTINQTIKTLLSTQSTMLAAVQVLQDRINKPLTLGGKNDPPLDMN